jgi:Holliday junction resolvase RusA-like endonuclease
MVYWFVDMFKVEDSKGTTLSFVVTGDPPVQERGEMNWKNGDRPTIYNPSSAAKKRYGMVVKQVMVDIGSANFPYLSGIQPVTLETKFFLPRCKQDYRVQGTLDVVLGTGPNFVLTDRAQLYPQCKDVDNLLKFAMDALEKIVNKDNNSVVSSLSSKHFPPAAQSNSEGWEEVQISVPKPT